MREAGGRLFVDVTRAARVAGEPRGPARSPGRSRTRCSGMRSQTVLDRGDFIPSSPDPTRARRRPGARSRACTAGTPIETDPAIVAELIARARRHRLLEARHPGEVGTRADRLHPGGHPGAEADPVRSAEPSGDHGRHGRRLVAQRAARGVAGREERGGHARTVRADNVTSEMGLALLDVADVDPPAREVVASCSRSTTRISSTRCPRLAGGREARDAIRGVARQVRHARRRRDRHHAAALERSPPRSCRSSSATSRTSSRAPARDVSSRATGGLEEGAELLERLRALPDGERKAERPSG